MKKLSFAALLLLAATLLGATVLREPVADAATATLNVFVTNDSAHPVPVHEQGNVKVSEQAVTQLIGAGKVSRTSRVGPFDVRGFKQVRITVGDFSCNPDDRLDISTPEESTSGSGFYRMELVHLCAGVSTGTSLVYEVPGRTLKISCFCAENSHAEIAVWGRSN